MEQTISSEIFYRGSYGRPTCPSEKAELVLPAATLSKTQPTSVATPWSWDVSSLASPGKLPSLLKGLPERPMASALLEELMTGATKVTKSQIDDAVGNSQAALVVEEDPQERGIEALLVEPGAGGGAGSCKKTRWRTSCGGRP